MRGGEGTRCRLVSKLIVADNRRFGESRLVSGILKGLGEGKCTVKSQATGFNLL